MVERGQELGLDVYLVNVLPWNNGHPGADAPIAELNRRIAAIGRDAGRAGDRLPRPRSRTPTRRA